MDFDFTKDAEVMPGDVERAFQAHYEVELEPSGLVEQTLSEIEEVYSVDEESVVSCSGGKDSMVLLALAEAADVRHRVLHWDWGARLIPRELEKRIIEYIRRYVDDDRFLVAARSCAVFDSYSEHDAFKHQLRAPDGIKDSDGSLRKLAGVLRHSKEIGTQMLGLRKAESGKRERKLIKSGLWGESLSQPAAFPVRNWSARDIWSYIVYHDVGYLGYYDRVSDSLGGGVAGYEAARLSTLHDPEFSLISVDGDANWRYRDVLRAGTYRERRGDE